MKKIFKGQILRDKRKEAGFSLRELAEKVNQTFGYHIVDYRTISRWERNPSASPFHNKISKVAKVLDIQIEELYETIETDVYDIISYNVNSFFGPISYDKRSKVVYRQRNENMMKISNLIKKFLSKKNENLAVIQEIPSDMYEEFIKGFEGYKIIEPIFKGETFAYIYTIGIANSNSVWKPIKEEESIFLNNKDFHNRVIEFKNKNFFFLGVHMKLDVEALSLWDRLIIAAENKKYAGIFGDFNAHFNMFAESKRKDKLQELIDKGFKDLVPEEFVTFYEYKTTLDHILVADYCYTDKCCCEVIPINFSDHALIKVKLCLNL